MKRKSKIENAFPRDYIPMLATLTNLPKDNENYAYEYKWDGARAITYWDKERLIIHSRNLNDVTFRYPELQELKEALGSNIVALDGEIVALGEEGMPDFKPLTHRMHISANKVESARQREPVYYYIFDILFLNGQELIDKPYIERRKALEGLNINTEHCKVPRYYLKNGEEMLQVATENGLEGIMVKTLDGKYLPGMRGKEWLKVKVKKEQEFVIGGWIEETKSPVRIGSLLVGYYERKKLVHAGRVGTGLNDRDQKEIYAMLSKIEIPESPFVDYNEKKAVIHYVKPKYVAQVQYRRWYSVGSLQQSSFKGLRYDKKPTEVVREKPKQI